MDRFSKLRAEAQKKMEEELARIEEAERAHERRVVNPLASKFAALIEEEVLRFGAKNLGAVEGYQFKKADLRAKLREFVAAEILAAAES